MAEGRRLVAALAEIATLAAEPFDVELLQVAADRIARVLDLDGVSILVSTDGQQLAWALPAAGVPGLERVVTDDDVAASEALAKGSSVTWSVEDEVIAYPTVASRARSLGALAVAAVPMRHRDRTLGVLLIASTCRRRIPARTVLDAERFADVIAAGVVREHAHRLQQALNEQLQHALNTRVVVEQAKGMVAADLNVGIDVALQKLRGFARSNHLKLHDVAADVVNRQLPVDILRAS